MSETRFVLPNFGIDAARYAALAQELQTGGDLHSAATVYDHAFGIAPNDAAICIARQTLLNSLAIVEHGIVFRYIPAGTFLMGSDDGDPDERPVHSVYLDRFWMAETPLSWAAFCELMDCEPPPSGKPRKYKDWDFDKASEAERHDYFGYVLGERHRLQYCEDETTGARDWHAHDPDQIWINEGYGVRASEIFGKVPRENPNQSWGYNKKPMITVGWEIAKSVGEKLSTSEITYRLPTEARWEKAARGGLVGKRYAWGDESPTHENCDFDHFEQFAIQQSRKFPPNGYGLYAMSGGVWEWTADLYDAEYYARSPEMNPTGAEEGTERVLRGGSWADCADAVRVAFRMSKADDRGSTPTIGFRLCRIVA